MLQKVYWIASLGEVGLDPDVPDPGAHVAGVLHDLVDELLLGVAPDGRGPRRRLVLLAPVQQPALGLEQVDPAGGEEGVDGGGPGLGVDVGQADL